MKLSIDEILEKIEELNDWEEITNFISSLNLTPEQMEILADHENVRVRYELAENPSLTEEVMIKLSNDEDEDVRYWLALNPNLTKELMVKLSNDEGYVVRLGIALNPKITDKLMIELASDWNWGINSNAFERLEKLNFLSSEDLESAYDLIRESKHISRENFKKTFDYIIDKFPELSELAKMFKRIILKGKRDLK